MIVTMKMTLQDLNSADTNMIDIHPIDIQSIRQYFIDLQRTLCQMFSEEDGQGKFINDDWQHPEGGGGSTRILTRGAVLEKTGVNFSHVKGLTLPPSATLARPELTDCQYEALGVSVVVHPLNPYIPCTHANLRFFIATKRNTLPIWWIGGGFDLTPYYPFEEDCIHWHQTAANACSPFGREIYPKFKKWCDDYFYLKHRKEARGIGGIFFDDLNTTSTRFTTSPTSPTSNGWSFETCFKFVQSVGSHFIKAYQPILNKRKTLPFGEKEKNFQCYRRGRYVEFNLLYDRGTLFGLQSGGRTESILMSLPPEVHWNYHAQNCIENHDIYIESDADEQSLKHYLQPRNWF